MMAPAMVSMLQTANDFTSGIMTGQSADTSAGMSAGPAEIQILEFRMIISNAEHRPRGKQLVKAQSAVKDIAAVQSKFLL